MKTKCKHLSKIEQKCQNRKTDEGNTDTKTFQQNFCCHLIKKENAVLKLTRDRRLTYRKSPNKHLYPSDSP